MSHIFSVSELTSRVREELESDYPLVWVRGQISNLARPASGHMYFTLRDAQSALSVVWFKNNQWLGEEGCVNPLTGEVCESPPAAIAEGDEVLVAGRLTLYGPRGQFQLVAEVVQPQGVGGLALAFEQLKAELATKGYFAPERKRPVPRDPARVAVVTSPTGAAVRDFVRVAEARGIGTRIRIYPTVVQGDAAPAAIARAMQAAEVDGFGQVLVLIRGGGSLEDMWAFNTREVADGVFNSSLPVLCGVGHEVDVSIADMVADERAATPSHAAQLLFSDREELEQRVDELSLRLEGAGERGLRAAATELAHLERTLGYLSPSARLSRMDEGLREATERLHARMDQLLGRQREALDVCELGLARGLSASYFFRRLEAVAQAEQAAHVAMRSRLDAHAATLDTLVARLDGLDPEAPLARGYGLIRLDRDGSFLRGPDEVTPGDGLTIRVARGEVHAVVDQTD